MTLANILISVLLLLGALIMVLASVGLLRFGDVYLRMHAGTKASTLGIGFIMIGTALYFSDALLTIKLIALGVIYFFTAPTGAQVLARAAHIARTPTVKETWIDELDEAGESKSG
ncbi:MAG: monovalent cation/H(+) antiporter subunit G [Chloroflexi bacterium]|nr:monovalent cation/H(+) antiporter subunit G [Chloroflexota bacterium]